MRIVIILCLWPPPRKVLRPETFDSDPNTHGAPLPQGNTPPLNFACNSPAPLSNFEFISLEFRGFLPIVDSSDHRIACKIGDEGLKGRSQSLARNHADPEAHAPFPHLITCPHAPGRPGPHTLAFHEPARTNINSSKIL